MLVSCSFTLSVASRNLSTRLAVSLCPSRRTIRTIRQFKPARRHRRQAPTKWWVHVPFFFTSSHMHSCIKRVWWGLHTRCARQHTCMYCKYTLPLCAGLFWVYVCQGRVGCKFIMVRRADGTVLRGLCWDCGGPLINHTDVIGRWEPHGCCRAQRWPHPMSPLRLTSDIDRETVSGRRERGRWGARNSEVKG